MEDLIHGRKGRLNAGGLNRFQHGIADRFVQSKSTNRQTGRRAAMRSSSAAKIPRHIAIGTTVLGKHHPTTAAATQ
jgi:hypothetical protein